MNKIEISYHKVNNIEFIIGTYDNKICIMDFRYRKLRESLNSKIKKLLNAEFIESENEVINLAKQQINDYFAGELQTFDLPLLLVGTAFQKVVWNELLNIPFGKLASYQDIANNINKPTAVRAVANANGQNSIAIIVPCHRVIGSNNTLTGYGGGLDIKQKLLALENNLFTL